MNSNQKIIELWVYENDDGSFIGESGSICINTNIPEIANTPIEFYGDSKNDIVQQILRFLQAKGEHGILRIV